ncbi:hypothetical protein EGW08_018117, partial [Elysia chlorotica]
MFHGHKKSYYNSSRRAMTMAGFGRGQNFTEPQPNNYCPTFQGSERGSFSDTSSWSSSNDASEQWAESVREAQGSSRRPSVAKFVIETHIEELESIWLDDTLGDQKKKQLVISNRLSKVFRQTTKVPNPWEFILHVILGVSDYQEAKASTLAFTILVNFRNWADSAENFMKDTSEMESCLSQELRLLAFNSFSGKHIAFFNIACKAFRLNHEGNEYFLPVIRSRLQQNKLTEVANLVGSLGLQDHFSENEILIPLLLSDKVNMLEAYVASSQLQQTTLLSLLDHLCAKNTDILSFAQKANVRDIKGNKLSKKILSKFAVKLMKLYSIAPETCPNITENRAMGAIRYLLYKRYFEKSLGDGSWDDMVESTVGENRNLQQQFVEELIAYDLDEAARWASLYQLPDSALHPAVVDQCRKLKQAIELQPEGESQGRWMEVEENWESEADQAGAAERDKYYHLPLPESQIIMVDNRGQLKACLHRLTEPGTIIGIDAEWKPAMGMESVERVALLQLAVEKAVYLVDLVTLSETLTEPEWVDLAESIFCQESVIKIG